MNAKILAASGLALVALTGLIQSQETKQQSGSSPAPITKTQKAEQYTTIGFLEKRDKVIAMLSAGPTKMAGTGDTASR